MNIILLSGGSGERLWPLSNGVRSKQFLKLLTAGNGNTESMIQRVYRQLRDSDIDAQIVIATSASQVDPIHEQLGSSVNIVAEPERRDTFPAIALSVAYLYYELCRKPEEPVIVMPVDPWTEKKYFDTIIQMERAVIDNVADIVLMGIKPTYASEKYGYILPTEQFGSSLHVKTFIEKPNAERAAALITEGALWNGGVFSFRIGYLISKLAKQGINGSFKDIYTNYSKLKKISFDYEVVERAESVAVIPFDGLWKDLGTWNTLCEEITGNIGKVICGEGTQGTKIVNELDIPIVALGLKDMIVAASHDGILISGKHESSYIKPYTEKVSRRPMYEERRWGYYKVLDYNACSDGKYYLTKHLFISADKKLSYQSHNHRDEIWTIVDGAGVVLIDGHTRNIRKGDVVYIAAGMKHALGAVTDLRMIEVQIGHELTETDIIRYAKDW